MQGAHLFSTNLTAANLSEAIVWGSKQRTARTPLTDFTNLIIDKSYVNAPSILILVKNFRQQYVKQMDQAGLENMISLSTDGLRKELRRRVRAKLMALSSLPQKEEKETTAFWQKRINGSVDETEVAKYLGELGCSEEGAPFVAQGLIRSGRLGKSETTAAAVAEKFLKDPNCVGAAKLSSGDLEDLNWQVDTAASKSQGE